MSVVIWHGDCRKVLATMFCEVRDGTEPAGGAA